MPRIAMTAAVVCALALAGTACDGGGAAPHGAPAGAAPAAAPVGAAAPAAPAAPARRAGVRAASLIVDVADTPRLPKNFRVADRDESGSGALSAKSMESVKRRLGSLGARRVIDVDLRQESHLVVNGIGVSWYGDSDDFNLGLSQGAVLSDEAEKKALLTRAPAVDFQAIPGKSVRLPGPVRPRTVQTEEELARTEGLGYFRLTVPDHHRPQDGQVDRFVAFARNLPPGTWLHFHCRGGVGRTTMFMTMYDIMRNARRASLEEIIRAQVRAGGRDLLSSGSNDRDASARERTAFLRQFYAYARQNQDGFRTPFSAWASRRT